MTQKTAKASCFGQIKYFEKTCGLNFKGPELAKPLPGKTYAPAQGLKPTVLALVCGKNSGRSIEKYSEMHADKLNRSSYPRRSTIAGLLAEERVACSMLRNVRYMFSVTNRLRLNKQDRFKGKIIVTLDAIDLGEIHKGSTPCGLCLPRVRDGVTFYFHKVVVLSIVTGDGPIPIDLRFVMPSEISHLAPGISEEKLKTECELTASKALLRDLAKRFGGKLPFDILTADALFANAPFMEMIEALGSLCIFAFKHENRILFKEAKKDFSGEGFGFDVLVAEWNDLDKKSSLTSKMGDFDDKNRKGGNKSVKIVEIIRTQTDGIHTTMAIASHSKIITAELVEEARLARWRDHENGIFNELTNGWKTAKHIFFHDKFAMISMMAIMLFCLGASGLYRKRNLTRGGRKFMGSLQDYFDQIMASFYSMRTKRVILLFQHPPPVAA